jgi:protein-S-isoprenylcysteine O-methyltransferase Ste14
MTDVGADPGVIRAAALFGPALLTMGLWHWRAPDRRLAAGALLATLWNLPALLAVHLVAAAAGWWRYEAIGGLVAGMPIDLLLGWALLWGAVPVLAFPRGALLVPLAAMTLADLVLMPLGAGVVFLGESWLTGEAVGLSVALLPALVLGRWTASDRRLGARAAMQVVLTGALLLWLLPLITLGTPWGMLVPLQALGPPLRVPIVAALVLPMTIAVTAVQEFVERGQGTPLPYDPPRRLVTTGPYAYIRNPMQTGAAWVLAACAGVSGSAHLAAAMIVAIAYGAGLAWWHENEELYERFGERWLAYRRAVPAWYPRWRPSASMEPGTVWVAATCGQCRPIAAFLTSRRPVQLTVRAAEEHPHHRPRRITYEAGGRQWEGVVAITRALDHLHLGWAFAGWCMRLPGVAPALQTLVDAAGGGPRDIGRSTQEASS